MLLFLTLLLFPQAFAACPFGFGEKTDENPAAALQRRRLQAFPGSASAFPGTDTGPTPNELPTQPQAADDAPIEFPSELFTCDGDAILQTEDFTKEDYEDVVEAVIALYDEQATELDKISFVGCVIRFAGHDFMDFRHDMNLGGADGCMNFGDGDNTGLPTCMPRTGIPALYKEHCSRISLADFVVIIGEAVMGRTATDFDETISVSENFEKAGSLLQTFRDSFKNGRVTETDCHESVGLMPNPEHGCGGLEAIFVDNIFSEAADPWRLTAAISGAHTVGSAKPENSGYDGFWSTIDQQGIFNNDYYKSYFLKGWEPTISNNNTNKNMWKRVDEGRDPNHSEIMLDSDLCLAFGKYDQEEGFPGFQAKLGAGNLDPELEGENCCTWEKPSNMEEFGIFTEGDSLCGLDLSDDATADEAQEACCSEGQGGNTCNALGNSRGPAKQAVIDFAANEQTWLDAYVLAWHMATENGHENLSETVNAPLPNDADRLESGLGVAPAPANAIPHPSGTPPNSVISDLPGSNFDTVTGQAPGDMPPAPPAPPSTDSTPPTGNFVTFPPVTRPPGFPDVPTPSGPPIASLPKPPTASPTPSPVEMPNRPPCHLGMAGCGTPSPVDIPSGPPPVPFPTSPPSPSPTTADPTSNPTADPTTADPTSNPTAHPTTADPTSTPTADPTLNPTLTPTLIRAVTSGLELRDDNNNLVTTSKGFGNVYFNGRPVCTHGWSSTDARVVCKTLGMIYSTYRTSSYYGRPTTSVFAMDDIACNGNEQHIKDCPHKDDRTENCHSGEVAGVVCYKKSGSYGVLELRDNRNGDMKITTNLGFGNVYLDGKPQCAYSFGSYNAYTVCNSIGMTYSSYAGNSKYGPAETNTLENRYCCGYLTHLSQCGTKSWSCGGCNRNRVASVNCNPRGQLELRDDRFGVDTTRYGYGNVYFNGKPVCQDDFDANDARVICRTLGMTYLETKIGSHWGNSNTNTFSMDNLACSGTESHIQKCGHVGMGLDNCSSHQVAGVICGLGGIIELRHDAEHIDTTGQGFGNVYYNGRPVCDDHWSSTDAQVVCRSLGMTLHQTKRASFYGESDTDSFSMDNVDCTGSETHLKFCAHEGELNENCSSNQVAGVWCKKQNGSVNPTGGSYGR